MKMTTININEDDVIIAIGNVKHTSIKRTLIVLEDELPENFRENMGEYCFKGGEWVQLLRINVNQEREWQRRMLNKINASILEYQSDKLIDDLYSELRISSISEDEYFNLLGDRKRLVEYVQQDDFPDSGRPTLLGSSAN